LSESSKDIATPTDRFLEMDAKWSKIDSLKGGTEAMRQAGKIYLPREDGERKKSYESRLARSVLFGALTDTVRRTVNRPLSSPITLKEEEKLKEPLDMLSKNVDRNDTTLQAFTKQIFEDAISYGVAYVLVDFPLFGAKNLLEQRRKKIQPIFTRYSPRTVIGWKFDKDETGKKYLAEVRLKEYYNKPNGDYDMIKDVRIRRIYIEEGITHWETHVRVKNENGEDSWAKEDSGIMYGYSKGIPLFALYTNKEEDMEASPPFEDLADLNIAHWQSMSDQRNILKYSRFAVLFGKGLGDKISENGLNLAANQAVLTDAEYGDLKYVEHTGKAIESGEKDLERLEERMEILGMQPFVRRSGNQTATAKSIDEGKQQTEIQAWVQSLENTLHKLYEAAAEWVSTTLPANFAIDVFNDFGLASRALDESELLLKSRMSGEISAKTYLKEIRKRGVLSDEVDVDEELERLQEEGPALSEIGMFEQPKEEEIKSKKPKKKEEKTSLADVEEQE